MRQRLLIIGGLALAAGILGWLLFVRLAHRGDPVRSASAAAAPVERSPSGRRIKARLFYVAEDGAALTEVERDVAFGENTVDQAREIVAAQIAPVAEPLVSAVPPGTTLRSVFVTDRGQAYVDLSHEIASAHPGGTSEELLTVYTIVDALTANLPAITSVQILVDGKQVVTLAGHVDLRRPLTRNLAWVQ